MPPLPRFTRELALDIVKRALKKVGDFPDSADIEVFTFDRFTPFHKEVFLTSLKTEVLDVKGDGRYYDIVLNSQLVSDWQTMKDCVDYVFQRRVLRASGNTGNISF